MHMKTVASESQHVTFDVPSSAAKLPIAGSRDCCWPKCQ